MKKSFLSCRVLDNIGFNKQTCENNLMRWKTLSVFFVVVVSIFSSAICTADDGPHFKKVIFFGDSLTDNGNFYNRTAHIIPLYPPAYKGRFSNGYNWADLVSYGLFSQYEIATDNFAFGGATAATRDPLHTYVPVTLASEISEYNAKYALSDKSDTLYIIWIGVNDYVTGDPNIDVATTTVINAITTAVQSLMINSGAQFYIIGLPDLSLTPRARQYHLTENYAQLVTMHNNKLHDAIVNLRALYPDHKIMEFNFRDNPILKNIIESPAYREKVNHEYGVHITNVTDACWTGGLTAHPTTNEITQNLNAMALKEKLPSSSNLQNLSAEITSSPELLEVYNVQQLSLQTDTSCKNPNDYLFWDHIHLTAPTYKILGNIMLNDLLKQERT